MALRVRLSKWIVLYYMESSMEILLVGLVDLPEKFKEVEYGEWSHTMNRIKKVNDISGYRFKDGDIVYVVHEGTYNKYRYCK